MHRKFFHEVDDKSGRSGKCALKQGVEEASLGHGAGCSQMGTDEGLSPKICPIFGIVHGRALLKRGRYGWRDPNGHFGKD